MKTPRFSVILPAYNEGESIGECIREVARAMAAFDHEIVVVDDGSTDGTLAHAREAANDACVKLVHYAPNRGKGYALKQGFAHADGDVIAFLDADNDLPPGQLTTLWQVMEQAHADVVIGSKLHPDSRLTYPPLRRLVSWGYFNLVHFLFGLPVHDTQTGIKLFRRQVLTDVLPRLQIEGFAFDLELLVGAHLFGYAIAEAPVVLNFHVDDPSPLKVVPASLGMAVDTLRVFYWTSFWRWLNPGFALKFWGLMLMGGLVAGSVGLGHLLNNFSVPHPFDLVVNVLLLRFLDRTVRDVLLFGGGIVAVGIAAIQLNREIVTAFSGRDRTDLLGKRNSRRRD